MLWAKFYDKNPYDLFPVEDFSLDLQGWGGDHPIFADIIAKIRPSLIIEVGTWKGMSALYMARLLNEMRIDGHILCIDTWLTSPEHFLDPVYKGIFKIKNGMPTLYHQFLANVILSGQTERITPLPQTSDNAFHILSKLGVKADMIYVDAAHEFDAVYRDLNHYWQLLKPGGVLLGDDYNPWEWPEIVRAVHQFTEGNQLQLFAGEFKYIIQKPH